MTETTEPGWFNYEFETDLDCPLGCGPGAHPLYIGKSNDSLRRLLEHAKKQPWFKHVTGWKIHPERYATERESLQAETGRIRAGLPLGNKAGNEGNRHKVYFGEYGGECAHCPPGVGVVRARREPHVVTRRVIPLQPVRRVPPERVAAVVGVAGVVSLGWWAACHFFHVVALAGLVASLAAVAALGILAGALSLRKRSPWRPVVMWLAVGVAAVSVWGLAGMPDWSQPPPPAAVPAVSR